MFASAAASLNLNRAVPETHGVPDLVMQIIDECCKCDGTSASKSLMAKLTEDVANAYDKPTAVVEEEAHYYEERLVCPNCENDDEDAFDVSVDMRYPVCCECGMEIAGACVPKHLTPFERPPPPSHAPVEEKSRSFYKRVGSLLDLVHQRLMAVGFGVVDSHGDHVAEVVRRLQAAKPYLGELHTSSNVARAVAIFAYHLRPPRHR